jgi:DNA-binding NarL/FixJ family response regulator
LERGFRPFRVARRSEQLPPDRDIGTAGVFVVEPHPVTLRGLRALVERAPALVYRGAAQVLAQALASLDGRHVDVIVVEPLAAPNDEEGLIAALSRAAPSARILALSARVEGGYVQRILKAGASGFISKTEASESVLGAIDRVLAGETVIDGVPGSGPGSS